MSQFIASHPALIYAFQLLIAESGLLVFLPKKKYWWAIYLGCSVVFMTVNFFLPDLIMGGFLYLPLIISFLLIGITYFFVCGMNVRGVVFAVIFVGLMQHTAECLTMSVRYLFDISSDSAMWMVLSLVCYVITYIPYFYYFSRRKGDIKLKQWKLIVMALVVFFGIFSLRNLAAIVCQQWTVDHYICSIYNAYAAICCVLCCAYMFSSDREAVVRDDNAEMSKLLRREQEHYAQLVSNQETINRKCHDLKYQIAEIRHDIADEEREERIARLEKDILIYESIAKTGNVALDYTISEKYLYCQQNSIQFSYMVDGESLNFMDPTDIYTLFGNALDNAIECVIAYEDVEKRIISLNVRETAGVLRIRVENYCEEKVKIENGNVETKKKDKENHGIGLKSIRYIAKKYGGTTYVDWDLNTFSLDIFITRH